MYNINSIEIYFIWDKLKNTVFRIGNIEALKIYLCNCEYKSCELAFSYNPPKDISTIGGLSLWVNRYMFFNGTITTTGWHINKIIDVRKIETISSYRVYYPHKGSHNNHTIGRHRWWYSKIKHIGALTRMAKHPDYIKYNKKKVNNIIDWYSWGTFRAHSSNRSWKDNKNKTQWEKHMTRRNVSYYDKREIAYFINEALEDESYQFTY